MELPQYKLVWQFLDEKYAKNELANWEVFRKEHSEITNTRFTSANSLWKKAHLNDPNAMLWFNEVRNKGGFRQVREFLDECFKDGESADWQEFHKKFPGIKHEIFYNGSYSWRNLHRGDSDAMGWFDSIRVGGPSKKEQVRRYLDWQCAASDIASREVFGQKYKTINEGVFYSGVYSWRDHHIDNPEAMRWFDLIRLGGISDMEQVRRYYNWQYASNDSVIWREFHEQHPTITKGVFLEGTYSWREFHKMDSMAMKWFREKRLLPSNNSRIMTWLDAQYTSNAPAWSWLFLEDNQDISQPSFQQGRIMWIKKHANKQKAVSWIGDYIVNEHYSAEVGKVFERIIIADLSLAFKQKNITIYYNTNSFESFGQLRGKNLKKARRVEMRLFAQDLLSTQSGIGPSLEHFLSTNQRPQVAIDLTIGGEYGKKISLYANATTSLLVVNPHGNKSQRNLESHVRVLSLQEFIGPQWLNLDKEIQKEIIRTLDSAQSSLRHGPDSSTWQILKTLEENKWRVVVDGLKTEGSQEAFQMRVANDIETQLRQGKIPKELTAYAEAARVAGHSKHAGQVEILAKVAVAVARVKETVGGNGAPKLKGIDPARLVEAREFAKVLQAARDADVVWDNEKEKKKNRLAEAREYARAIQEAQRTQDKQDRKVDQPQIEPDNVDMHRLL